MAAVKEWKLKTRAISEAQSCATHDGEPFGVVRENGVVYSRPLRKALAICNSPRHPKAELIAEVEPS